jgi:hypothetical protein
MRLFETIEVKSNLILTARERGKIVARREGHNIWLNLGREYLAQLIAYASFGPAVAERDDRIRYMGVGLGGNRQLMLGVANAAPLVTAYPGTNIQTDSDLTVQRLERPVRVSGSEDPYPGQGGDVWLGQVQAPATHPLATQTTFSRVFIDTDVSYGSFLSVPISEIMLFSGSANPNVYNNTGIAYDTFDTIAKTAAIEFEANWTIRF